MRRLAKHGTYPYIVIIAMWTILIALFVHSHVFPERLLAFLAEKCHFDCFR